MAATIISICSAVVTHLNDSATQATYGETFTAARVFSPHFDRETLAGLSVDVFPAADESEAFSRSGELHTFRVGVVIRKPIDPDSTSAGDSAIELVDQIKDSLKFVNMSGAGYISLTNDPTFSLEFLESRREFLSVIFVTYKKGR